MSALPVDGWGVAGLSGVGTPVDLASPSLVERAIRTPVALTTALLAVEAARSIEAAEEPRRPVAAARG